MCPGEIKGFFEKERSEVLMSDIKNMDLHKIATVVIDGSHCEDYHHNFIVAKVTGKDGMKIVVRASNEMGNGHYKIFHALQQEVKEARQRCLTVECIGGGTLDTDYQNWISIYGSSGSYGREPDRKETLRILEEVYPKFKVNIENA